MTTDRPEFSNDQLFSLIVTLFQELEQQRDAFRTMARLATSKADRIDQTLIVINGLRPQTTPEGD